MTELGFLGFVGIGKESNLLQMKDFLGSDGNSASSAAAERSREKGVISRTGTPNFDASTTGVGGWPRSVSKYFRSNELGIIMLA
jgi:hypothetical protein